MNMRELIDLKGLMKIRELMNCFVPSWHHRIFLMLFLTVGTGPTILWDVSAQPSCFADSPHSTESPHFTDSAHFTDSVHSVPTSITANSGHVASSINPKQKLIDVGKWHLHTLHVYSGSILSHAELADTTADAGMGELERVEPLENVELLEELLVTATYLPGVMSRSPLAVQLVRRDAADLRWRPAATLDEITAQLPGVQVSNRENYALGERITIRGLGWRSPFGVRGIRILLDEIPLTVADGQTIVTMADPAMVKRLEVIQGPSSTFYGNAAGGVIALYTSHSRDDSFLTARVLTSSYAEQKMETSWGLQLPKQWQMDGFVTRLKTDGYREHSAATIVRAHLGATWRPRSKETLAFHVHHTSMPFAEHPGALTEQMLEENPSQARANFLSAGAGKEFHQTMTGINYEKPMTGGTLKTSLHAVVRDLENPLPFGTILLNRYAGGGRVGWTFSGLPFDLQTGAELLLQRDDRQNRSPARIPPVTVTLDQAEQVLNQALFVHMRIPLIQNSGSLGRSGLSGKSGLLGNLGLEADLDAGLRADRVLYRADPADLASALFDEDRRDFFSLNPSVGVIVRLGRHQVFTHLSSSFETPTTTELVNQPDGSGGFNREVGPEKTLGLEAGLRLRSGDRITPDFLSSWSVSLTLYRMRVSNLLVPFELDEGGREYFRNQGASNHTGLELFASLGLFTSTDLRFSLHLSEASFAGGDLEGAILPGVPRMESSLQVRHENKAGSWMMEGLYRDRVPADSENKHWADHMFRLQAAWTSPEILFANRSLFLFFSINNLLNNTYVSSVNIDAFGGYFYEPGRPRTFSGGISLDLF